MGLDTNAWVVPEGNCLTSFSVSDIGISASQLSISGSNLVNEIDFGSFIFPGGFNQGGPATVPLKGGTIIWNKMQVLYGTVAIRAKLTGTGTHPTIWMLSAPARQTAYFQNPNVTTGLFQSSLAFINEIDIAEGVPFITGNTTTLRQNLFSPSTNLVQTTTVTDYSVNFHEYKIVWTPTSITWFVDGIQTNTTSSNIPDGPMYLLIDCEYITASDGGAPSSGNYPQQMFVDYVKAWDQNNNLIFSDDFTGANAFQNLSMSNLTFIQATSQEQVASSTTLSKAYPLNTTSNSLLLAFTLCNVPSGNPSVSDSLGNTWIPIGSVSRYNSGINAVQMFYVPSNKIGGGACTVTLTAPSTNSFMVLGLLEYTGQALSNPIDVAGPFTQGVGTTATSSTIVTSYSNETIVLMGVNGTGTAGSAGGGFNLRLSGLASQAVAEDQTQNTNGSYSGTWTQTSSASWGTFILGIKSTASQSPGVSWLQANRDFVNKRGIRGN